MDRRRHNQRRSEQWSDEAVRGSGSGRSGRSDEPTYNHQSALAEQAFPEFYDEEYQEFLNDWISRQSPPPPHPGQQPSASDNSWSAAMTSVSTQHTTLPSSSPMDYRGSRDPYRHRSRHSVSSPMYPTGQYYDPSQPYPGGSTSHGEIPALPAAAWGLGIGEAPNRSRRSVGYRPLSNWFGLWLDDDEGMEQGNGNGERHSDGEEGSDRERERERTRESRGDRPRTRRGRARGQTSGSSRRSRR